MRVLRMVLFHGVGQGRAATQTRDAAKPHEHGQQTQLLEESAGTRGRIGRKPGGGRAAVVRQPHFSERNGARFQYPKEKPLQTLRAFGSAACDPVEYGIGREGRGKQPGQRGHVGIVGAARIDAARRWSWRASLISVRTA